MGACGDMLLTVIASYWYLNSLAYQKFYVAIYSLVSSPRLFRYDSLPRQHEQHTILEMQFYVIQYKTFYNSTIELWLAN